MPPGPPVLKTVVAEIYGPPAAEYGQLIAYGSRLRRIFDHTSGLVDTDDFAVARQPRLQFVLDREKAALHGVNSADVAQTLALMLGGGAVDTVHTDTERDPLLIELRTNRPVAGFPDPTFFTATAMIGMIALAGIVVRNSIILIDFIHHGLAAGLALEEAILEAGAIRLRPIALTAGAAMLGSAVITLDPTFSGLA